MNTKITTNGTLVAWAASATPVRYAELQAALQEAGLDPTLAKAMAPRNAFSRAAKEMAHDRVIDKIDDVDAEAKNQIKFQFTHKYLQQGELHYNKECNLYLHKESGEVDGDNAQLVAEAQRLVNEHLDKRLPADITRLVQKIFDVYKGDLVAIRKQGGVYYVPSTHHHLIEKVETMLNKIGGELLQFDVDEAGDKTKKSVASSMGEYILGLLSDWEASVEALSDNSSSKTLERRLDELREINEKMRVHSGLLSGMQTKLNDAIRHGFDKFQAKRLSQAEAA